MGGDISGCDGGVTSQGVMGGDISGCDGGCHLGIWDIISGLECSCGSED